jgi:hypothetical protein
MYKVLDTYSLTVEVSGKFKQQWQIVMPVENKRNIKEDIFMER